MKMTHKTKSQLMVEDVTLRARLAEREVSLTERRSTDKGELSASDVAELRRFEAALKASEVRYRRLFETAKDGILILDGDTGRTIDANPFLLELLEYSHSELLGKRLWEIGAFRDIAANRSAFSKLQEEEYIRYENLPLETKGHWHRHVEFISNVYRENGKKVIQCNIRDITDRYQAEQALVKANMEMEKRVDERTAELLAANKLMKEMLDEGKRKEERVRKSRELLRKLSGRLQSMLEEERTRISREIHDEMGQTLTGLKLKLSLIRKGMVSGGLAEQAAKIIEIEGVVDSIFRMIRKISTELRPGILDELGVAAAIEWAAADFQCRTGIVCKVKIGAVGEISDNDLATAIFRIVQESLTNVMRHAAASRVDVSFEKKDGNLALEVRDNGVGIKEGRIRGSKALGLLGIRERVLLLGGESIIVGKPGAGTRIRVTLPIGNRTNSNG